MIASFIFAAALSGLQLGNLYRTDQDHSWTPEASTVAFLEHTLHVPRSMGGPLTNFDRYYTGIYRDRRKLVFVELVDLTNRPPGSGIAHVGHPNDDPAIADGGCGVIRLSYDPETKVSSSIECNAELEAPPPPPPHGL